MSAQSKKITPKKVIEYTLLLVIALALIYYSFRGVDWGEFWAGMKGCNWWWIALSMLIGVVEFTVRAIRWKLLLNQIHSPNKTLNAYRGVTIGNLTNFAVPRLGEIIRCTVVSTTDKIPFEGAVGTVVVERAWDLICLILLTASMFLFQNSFGSFIKENILGGMTVSNYTLGLIAGISTAIALVLIGIWFARSRARKKAANKEAQTKDSQSKVKRFISRFKEGILSVFKMKHKWYFFLLTVMLWGTYLLTSMFTIWAFPQLGNFTWGDALFLMIVGGLGWAVPVQAGIGAYHFIVSLALMQVYAMSQSESLAFATISHSSQAVVMIILGVISVIGYAVQKRKLLKD